MAEQFIILIVEPEWDPATVTQEDWAAEMAAHEAFATAVAAAGARIVDGDALMPPRSSTRITPGRDGGGPVLTDGPFPEVKEVVSGYYKLEVSGREQALALAARCPTGGYVEVTPVMPTS
ncbi:MAG: hypothetical protein KJ792_00855 [Actinobacteria bacterium]|nr:hypothetical protein [Actinomycetota bacterium]MCG2801225.1 YciI family protein [Cellulomonas sp.]